MAASAISPVRNTVSAILERQRADVNRFIDEEILKIKNRIFILGNHDIWWLDWMFDHTQIPDIWYDQGGASTIKSYFDFCSKTGIPKTHLEFIKEAIPFHITENGKVFVHGGFDPDYKIELQETKDLVWDRDLWYKSCRKKEGIIPNANNFQEIFIGHTSTEKTSLKPLNFCNVWNVDQGAGWGGVLTLLDVDSKEYWSSTPSKTLYPGYMGR